jgi:hypothetical protein
MILLDNFSGNGKTLNQALLWTKSRKLPLEEVVTIALEFEFTKGE